MGFDKDFAIILGVGNGVCGSAAIAATKDIVGLDKQKTGLAVAIVNFLGTVRAKDKNNKNILSMTLEHYPVMTENEILKITEKALKKWDINYISIIHRIGKLFPKDKIVYVGVSSKHRQNAFNACNFIMDYLKTNATFWKIEEFENENKWVIQDKKEIEALEKWS